MTSDVLWNDYHQQLRSFIAKRIKEMDSVEDILQNVFLKIHNDMAKKRRIGNIKAWLYQITRNTIIDFYRTRKINDSISEDIIDEYSDESVLRNVAGSIRFFINRLEEPYKKIMVLSEIRDLSQRDISLKLGLPYSTVKSRVQRARAKVKEMMLDCCHYEFDKRGNVIDYNCKRC
jgi:RNA polymerase sigma-70 factor, ECF subfamily